MMHGQKKTSSEYYLVTSVLSSVRPSFPFEKLDY